VRWAPCEETIDRRVDNNSLGDARDRGFRWYANTGYWPRQKPLLESAAMALRTMSLLHHNSKLKPEEVVDPNV
jgi:3-hydroxyacyl-CoA dehydrogenase